MPSFEVDIDFEIYCSKCGTGICNNGNAYKKCNGNLRLDMEPCDKCIESAVEIAEYKIQEEYEKKIAELESKIYDLENNQ